MKNHPDAKEKDSFMKRCGRLFFWIIGFVLLGGALTFSSAAGRTAQPAACINLLQDPSFEDYTPNSYWEEYSFNYSTPLCTIADCGSGGAGPRTGDAWAWFDAQTTPSEQAYVRQSVMIPEGSATLNFYLMATGEGFGLNDDIFFATIDTSPVFQTPTTEMDNYPTYTLVSVNVSYFADGGVHQISLGIDLSDVSISYHVDDVSLCVEEDSSVNNSEIFLPYVVMPPRVTQAPVFEPRDVPWVDTTFTLRWNAVEGANTYVIEEDTDMFFPHPTTVYNGSDTVWTASWRPIDSYYYRVRGENGLGAGPWSEMMWISYEGVYPMADAGIASGASGTNFGSLGAFSVGYYAASCPFGVPVATGVNRGLIAFDTTGVPTDLPFDKVVLSIYLDKICYLSSLDGATRTITAYRVTSPWSEGGVTWNNAPGTGESRGSVNITLSTDQGVFGRYEIEITSLVRDWLNGSQPNYGLVLRSNVESGAGFTFDTRDDQGATPYLSITFNAADTTSMAAALERIPAAERQCVIAAPGEMWCALKVK